ncbi:hypothetical protein [Paenibacillus sp. NPDC058177]|uniref:hypothetical protein n=1 Tax=Paenibacillus sp. NPDC058177 TaxID=3346369 RepID=UPI0036DB8227
MSYHEYDHEFYREPSEFEGQINVLKESLMNAIKDEHKAEVERLRRENAELQEVKRTLETIKRDYNQKVVELDMQKRDLKNEVRRERLVHIMDNLKFELFRAGKDWMSGPKCEKCDEGRQIHFLSPSGKKCSEDCDCKKRNYFYKPSTHICSSFEVRNGKVLAWYKPYSDADGMELEYLGGSNAPRFIYSGESFESIKEDFYGVYFRAEEDCQRYCDWLTEQEAAKKKES